MGFVIMELLIITILNFKTNIQKITA